MRLILTALFPPSQQTQNITLRSATDSILEAGQAIIVTSNTALTDPSSLENWDAQMGALKVRRR